MVSREARVWLGLGAVLLVALNLRLTVAALPPVLPDLRVELGMSSGVAGLLTTLPVICFGLLAPVAARVGRRLGSDLALLVALVVLIAGVLLRSTAGILVVVAGTVLIGAGIAVGNVLVPSVIKQDYPHLTGLATGLYTTALAGGAALGAGFTAPLAYDAGLGWRVALAFGAVPAVIAALMWLLRLRRGHPALAPVIGAPHGWVWRSPLAWQLAVFMGSQSLLFYSILAWLPALLQDRGVSATQAGLLLSAFNLLGILGAISLPSLATRSRDQRWLAVLVATGWLAGVAGLWLVPAWYVAWTVLLGVFQGAGISMAMALIVLRSAHSSAARDLSGMVQSAGYLMAAGGPFVIGLLRDWTGAWTLSLATLTGLAGVMAVAGYRSGRNHVVG